MAGSRYREGSARFNVQMDQTLIDWLDLEAEGRERSRNWVIVEACKAWKRRVERARDKQAERARLAAEVLVKGRRAANRG